MLVKRKMLFFSTKKTRPFQLTNAAGKISKIDRCSCHTLMNIW